MKVAYLLTRADPIGGAQVHVRDLAVAVRQQGHEVVVLTAGRGPLIESLTQHGIPVRVLRHLTAPIRPHRDVLALREIHAALAAERPDLVAAHSSKAGVLARFTGRSLRIPVVFTVHGWAFTPGIPPLRAGVYRRVERAVAPLASRLITVSEFDRRLALAARIASAERITTIHNGMPDVAPSLRADPGRSPPRLIMVGRFEPQKDQATLLRALGGLRDLPWELDLVGDGPRLDPMRALAEQEGIGARVHFLGQRTDVAQLLARGQASILATNWEGFPLSILEAMRAGLPVVASAVGGVEESIDDGRTGFLVARGDVSGLRERLRPLLLDGELRCRLGAAGRSRFAGEFSLERMVSRTLAVYREVLDEGAGPR